MRPRRGDRLKVSLDDRQEHDRHPAAGEPQRPRPHRITGDLRHEPQHLRPRFPEKQETESLQ